MHETDETPARPRWPKGQRFHLLPRGLQAQDSYRAAIVASRAEAGRRSFEEARAGWATRLSLEADDNLLLAELQAGDRSIEQLSAALEEFGARRAQVRDAVDRLVRLQLVEPVARPEPTPRRRW